MEGNWESVFSFQFSEINGDLAISLKTRLRAALVKNGYVHFLLLVQEKVDRKRRTPEMGMFRFIPLSGLSPFSDQREGCGPLFGNTPEDALLGGEIKEGNRVGQGTVPCYTGGGAMRASPPTRETGVFALSS